ncbi:TPA: hypothetical protein ACWYFJ_003644, partial [Morganella morganii]
FGKKFPLKYSEKIFQLFIFINASLFPQYTIELKNHISLYAITYAKTIFRTDSFHYLSKGFFCRNRE